MAITLETVEMYNEDAKKIVSYDVALVDDETTIAGTNEDGSPIYAKVLTLTYKDTVHKYSPNTSEEELLRQVDQINQENK